MSKLLIVDDEESICWGLSRLGQDMGHEVTTAPSAEDALEFVRNEQFDVVVLDVRLPGMNGLAAIGELRQHAASVPIVVMTAYGDLETAVEAVRQGAFEYLVKPFDTERVRQVVTSAVEAQSRVHREISPVTAVEGLVGTTPAMQDVFSRIALAAAANASVLLHGESGTGKELAAQAIHRYSSRRNGPFVAVNVAALSPALAESELFGHVRGAFTGADHARVGLLSKAHGGTLFLDEVADIPLPTQVKLLRALESGEVLPVGADEPIHTDIRVIAASHRDLEKMARDGSFRHDLFFRIATFQINLPPLRARTADILPLAHFFASVDCDGKATADCPFSEEAIRELQSRPWYGNVRELRNAVEHARIMARGGQVMAEHLPAPLAVTGDPISGASLEAEVRALLKEWAEEAVHGDTDHAGRIYDRLLALVEPPAFRAVLASQQGQVAAAARLLGVHRTTLRKKLDQYGL